jgi:hypothetical protein
MGGSLLIPGAFLFSLPLFFTPREVAFALGVVLIVLETAHFASPILLAWTKSGTAKTMPARPETYIGLPAILIVAAVLFPYLWVFVDLRSQVEAETSPPPVEGAEAEPPRPLRSTLLTAFPSVLSQKLV